VSKEVISAYNYKLRYRVLCIAYRFFVLSMAYGLSSNICLAQNEAAQANVTSANVTANVPAQPDASVGQSAAPTREAPKQLSLSELLVSARKAKDKGEFDKVYELATQAMQRFGNDARAQQKALKDFPPSEQINNYAELNNMAECQFIKAEALKNQGKKDGSIAAFKVIVTDFSFAQAWDPRGWFYKLAKTAREAIDRMEGRDVEAEKCGALHSTKLVLNDSGKEEIVNYDNYGDFEGAGTKDYKFVVKSQGGLSEAVGEGIYPNTMSVRWDPAFQAVKKERRIEGSHWDFVHSPDLEAAFFKWALAPEPPGIRLFYTALILERAGLYKHAVKAYYAIVVHYPRTVGWTYWHTPWYIGPASIAKIKYLCKKYPQVNMKLVDSKIDVQNGFDTDISNDIFIVEPGRLIKNHIPETFSDKFNKFMAKRKTQSNIIRKLGDGKVRFVQYANGHWQLLVDDKPYMIHGITYSIAKAGQSPDDGALKSWMDYDYNNNGKCDGPYDAFVDANKNNKQDADEPSVGDYQLMKRMGVNTIRLYHQPFPIKKELLRDLYARFGIRVIMGDFLGKYALGSGADWNPGTDYENPEHCAKMLGSVKQMVLEHKDEPYLLMWMLGNENVYGVACNADKKPEAFYKFVNEAAKLIKSLDKGHPVVIANGDVFYLDKFAKYAPDVDAFGANAYRGDYGFGTFWEMVKNLVDRPAFITEYGCSAYVYCFSREAAEEKQADYLEAAWRDIVDNSAFAGGQGNAVGGILFEWLDEWWKGYEPSIHDTKGLWVGPFPDGFMHEEWLGVAGQGDGILSPFLRQLRKSYYVYQKLWEK